MNYLSATSQVNMSYKAPWASPRNVPSLSTITLFFLLITRNACGRPRLKFAWVSSKSDSEISRELQCFTLKFNSVGWGYHEVYHFDRWLRIISAVVDFLSPFFYFLFHSFTFLYKKSAPNLQFSIKPAGLLILTNASHVNAFKHVVLLFSTVTALTT